MSQATQLIASQYRNAAMMKHVWAGVMYNVLEEGLVGDGVTDDTVALQSLINKAISEGRKAIFFPHGTYNITALTNDNQVIFFGDNATFTGGYTGTILQLGDAVTQAAINNTLLSYVKKGDLFYNVLDNGLKGDGTTDDTTALQNLINQAISSGRKAIYFPHATYKVTALTNDNQVVFFGDNASFTGGYAGTILQIGDTLTQSALNSTLQSYVKKSDLFYNVKDYGAKGDGVTDDYAAFAAAIAACPAGGEVFVPFANAYRLSQKLLINKPIKLSGAYTVYEIEDGMEKGNVLKFDNTVTTGIEITSYATLIEGISVELTRTSSDVVAAIFYNTTTSGDMRNTVIRNVNTFNPNIYGAGVKSDGAITMTLENVRTNQGKYGFYFDSPAGNGTSVTFIRTWAANFSGASGAGSAGYYINNYDYCQFLNTTADSVNSPDNSYYFVGCDAINLSVTAAEQAQKSIYVFDNCVSVSMNACFGYLGNAGGSGAANASFAELKNGTKFVTMHGCSDYLSSGYTKPNIFCDATSLPPVTINCDFPKGVSENGTVTTQFTAASTRSYAMIGRSVLTDSPSGSGVLAFSGRQVGSAGLRMGVLQSNLGGWLGFIEADGTIVPANISLPAASAAYRGRIARVEGASGVQDKLYICRKKTDDTYEWFAFA